MTAFERYVAPARAGAPGLWRVAVGLAVMLAAVVLATISGAAIAAATGAARLDDPRMLAAQVFGLTAMIPALALVAPWLHRRRFAGLLAADGGLDRRGLGFGALLALGVALISGAPAWALGLAELRVAPRADVGWALVAVLALLIPLQAMAEELVFRGYLMQELAARSRWPLIWFGAPVMLFTLLHLGASGGGLAEGAYLARVAAFGLFASAMVWRAGALAPAIGFHAANNLLALLLFRTDLGVAGVGPLRVTTAPGADGALLLLDLAALAAALPLIGWRRADAA